MPDTLRQLTSSLRRSSQVVEYVSRRGGLLPQVERTRGNLLKTNSMVAPFHVKQEIRRVQLNLTFYKASIL